MSVGVSADLVSDSVAAADSCVAVEDWFESTVVPAGLRLEAVAVLFTAPASTSACVIV